MKKFIWKCAGFSFLLFPMFLLFSFIRTATHEPYPVQAGTRTILTGDSHVQCAIRADRVEGMENISLDSEGYYYSYHKIKRLLETRPHIQNVILGFSYHNLSSYYDEYTIGRHAKSILRRYVDLLRFEDLSELIRDHPLLIWPVCQGIFAVNKKKYPYIGEFTNHDTGDLVFNVTTMQQRINDQFYIHEKVRDFSEHNLAYLDKVIQVCARHKVNLLLIKTPLHPRYVKGVPPEFIDQYNRLTARYQIPVIEFDSIDLSDSHFLPDGDHVNAPGSIRTTEYFKKKWAGLGF